MLVTPLNFAGNSKNIVIPSPHISAGNKNKLSISTQELRETPHTPADRALFKTMISTTAKKRRAAHSNGQDPDILNTLRQTAREMRKKVLIRLMDLLPNRATEINKVLADPDAVQL